MALSELIRSGFDSAFLWGDKSPGTCVFCFIYLCKVKLKYKPFCFY